MISLPNKIGIFTKYNKKPNAISCGTLYTATVNVDVPFEKKRTLRVYLPEDYDGNKSFPVLYMCDAQNIVDRYTTAYGEWDIDDHMHELIKRKSQSFIVAGLDCPLVPFHRVREYVMDEAHIKGNKKIKGYGKQYANYIVEVIKPLIDNTFKTLKDKDNTGFGGSSMGGLFAFDIVTNYPDIFGFSLSFSPAFFVLNSREYNKETLNREFDINKQKIYFFSGGKDLDAKILPGTIKMYRYLKELGYDDNHVGLLIDSEVGHCEASWSKYFKNAIEFWQK